MTEERTQLQDVGKQQLLHRSNELEFIDDAGILKCTRCNRLAAECCYTNCGHALCPNCKRLLSDGRCRCPQCDQFIESIKEQSSEIHEKINGLQVKCLNNKYGCSLITTFKELPDHLVDCKWTREKALPAVYKGTNTLQMLLEEVSQLKQQMKAQNVEVTLLRKGLNRQNEVAKELKNIIEKSNEDVKNHINGIESNLQHETALQKTEITDVIYEKMKEYFASNEEVVQLEEIFLSLHNNTSSNFIQMLDQNDEKFSNELSKEIQVMNSKILTNEEKIKDNENNYITALKNCCDRIEELDSSVSSLNNDLQNHMKKSTEELKNLTSNLTTKIEQKDRCPHRNLSNLKRKKNDIELYKIQKQINEQKMTLKQKITANNQILQDKITESIDELKTDLEAKMTNLSNDVAICDEKIEKVNIEYTDVKQELEYVAKDQLSIKLAKAKSIEDLNLHLNPFDAFQRVVFADSLLEKKSSLNELVDSFLFGTKEEQMAFEHLCCKWTIKDFQTKFINSTQFLFFKRNQTECLSDLIPIYGYDLKAQLKLSADLDGDIKLDLCFKDEEKEGQVECKVAPKVIYILKDLSEQKPRKDRIRSCSRLFNHPFRFNEFCQERSIANKSSVGELLSASDKSLEILLLLEPTSLINKMSTNGTIIDIVQHYEEKLKMEKKGLVFYQGSPIFLTHPGGYRVAVAIHFGESMANNKYELVADVNFLSGEFDYQLKDDFPHETIITLIHPLDTSKNITVRQQSKDTSYYRMMIATEDEISSCGFIDNNSLMYQVTIRSVPLFERLHLFEYKRQ